MFNLGSLTTLDRRKNKEISLRLVTDLAAASKVAARKWRQVSTPSDTISVKCLPSVGSAMEIGDPVVFSSERLGIDSMICRVIDLEESEEYGIGMRLQEDVYRIVDVDFQSGGEDPTTPPVAALAQVLRPRIVEIPWELKGNNNADIALIFGRGSKSQSGVTLHLSWDNTEYLEIGQENGYCVTGELAADYPLTPKVDRIVHLTFDADNTDVASIANVNEADFFQHKHLALVGDELMSIKSLVPVPGGTSAGGRWRIQGIIRGVADTDPAAHSSGTTIHLIRPQLFFTVGVTEPMGVSFYMKAAPYHLTQSMELDDVDAVGPYEIRRRAASPLPICNLKANARFVAATYVDDIHVTWDYRVRGRGAGAGVPSSGILYAALAPEGFFVIDVVVGGIVKRTLDLVTDDTAVTGWTYTEAMNLADNGSLATELEIRVRNREHFYTSAARTIIVRSV